MGSTEEKIKQAARKLFTKNGFAAVKTRDIAAEAGINLALLNYYFRSKEKLFEIIMLENMSRFIAGVSPIINNEDTTIEQKLDAIISMYIDKLLREPDLPMFILSQTRTNMDYLMEKLGFETLITKSYLFKQILKSDYQKMIHSTINPLHLVINLFSLMAAPFIMAPMIQRVMKLDEKQFETLMQERKALIPKWLASIVKKG